MRCRALAMLLLACPELAKAQCANGSPPPCAMSSVARPRLAIDPQRIAIIPFRVVTTDTLLGEGFAELLANEFTGEGSPRAIDMATVVGTWRRAGGGLRTPLTRDVAQRVSRDIGAGLMVEGSLTGLGAALTVSATILNTVDGATRGAPVRVSGSPDSLDMLLRRAAAGLLVAAGSQARAETGARFSESGEAMRAYMQGMSAWRRGRLGDGVARFNRAIEADSSFAQALFARFMAFTWGFPQQGDVITRLAFTHRMRLSRPQRMVLEAFLGAGWPAPRMMRQALADRRAAAEQLPDSPEALYVYGDWMFHFGAAVANDHLSIARDYLSRAAAIDSQALVLRHVLEVGFLTGDTALLGHAWPAFDRTELDVRWCFGFLAAAERGDVAGLNALRRRRPTGGPSCGASAQVSSISASLIDEMYALLIESASGAVRTGYARDHGFVVASRGRPAAAERIWSTHSVDADVYRLNLAAAGAEIVDIAGAVHRASIAAKDTGAAATAMACGLTALRAAIATGVTPSVVGADASPSCAALADWEAGMRDGWHDSTLAKLDSLNRNVGSAVVPHWPSRVLATIWEKKGEPRRALGALRSRVNPGGFAAIGALWREEGRVALVVGDTLGAIRAYRNFLRVTRDAEPVVDAQRASVRDVLARIERRR